MAKWRSATWLGLGSSRSCQVRRANLLVSVPQAGCAVFPGWGGLTGKQGDYGLGSNKQRLGFRFFFLRKTWNPFSLKTKESSEEPCDHSRNDTSFLPLNQLPCCWRPLGHSPSPTAFFWEQVHQHFNVPGLDPDHSVLPRVCSPLTLQEMKEFFILIPNRTLTLSFSLCSWLNHKGVRQKRINDWLGIKNESTDE